MLGLIHGEEDVVQDRLGEYSHSQVAVVGTHDYIMQSEVDGVHLGVESALEGGRAHHRQNSLGREAFVVHQSGLVRSDAVQQPLQMLQLTRTNRLQHNHKISSKRQQNIDDIYRKRSYSTNVFSESFLTFFYKEKRITR